MAKLPMGGKSQIAKIRLAATAPTRPGSLPQNREATITACKQIIGAAKRNSHPLFIRADSRIAAPAHMVAETQDFTVIRQREDIPFE